MSAGLTAENAVAALHAVSRRFGRVLAVREVTVSFHACEIVGIVGSNGAGKTTALRMLAGVLRPSAGCVEVPPAALVSYFAGEHTLPPDVSAARWTRICAPDLTTSPDRRFGVLSRGTRQRVGLEAALADTRTQLLVLDEPWEGLDVEAGRWLSDRLMRKRTAGAAVVVSSHRIHDLALICDRCLVMSHGELAGTISCSADMSLEARVDALLAGLDWLRETRIETAS